MKLTLGMLFVSLFAVLPGCAWVETTPEGEQVHLGHEAEIGDCKKVGMITASGVNKYGFIERNEDKVKEELAILARNEAAEMGANVIVPEDEVVEGRQRFVAYFCSKL
ncbi:lipoprotein [Oleiphilus messinensis]|uniref:Lipoprotein n=1 Tax=Oleiphilus messinensis TaxID=141451 RepID=A0A1Y0IHL6_9GAMM|nr:DUF4156 domain-containing protein [Oleiphilus messinensis]ARU58913.1 lipoprotein [Oleiphilus messinensis]